MNSFDLAVVGAGPVGALMALLAAQSGFRVALLDAAPAPRPHAPQGDFDLRVVALSPASRAAFERVGAWPGQLSERIQAYAAMEVWDCSGPGRIGFSAAELGVPELGHIIEVPAVQWALDQAIAAQSDRIDRWQAAEFSRYKQAASGLELRCRDGRSLQARMLIGADGRDSQVRKRSGIGLASRDYQQSGVVAVLQPEQAHAGVARQAFSELGPLGLLPLANGQVSMVWSVAQDRAAELLSCDPAQFCQLVAQVAGQPGFALCSARRAFALKRQNAETYACDEIALIGDAAHAIHPLAGLGMNLGVGDALSLAACLQHWRPSRMVEAYLQQYARERRRQVLPALLMMDALNDLFGSHSGEVLGLRDFGLNLVDRLGGLKREFMRYALGSIEVPVGDSAAKTV